MSTLARITLSRFLNDYCIVNCQMALFLAGSNVTDFLIKFYNLISIEFIYMGTRTERVDFVSHFDASLHVDSLTWCKNLSPAWFGIGSCGGVLFCLLVGWFCCLFGFFLLVCACFVGFFCGLLVFFFFFCYCGRVVWGFILFVCYCFSSMLEIQEMLFKELLICGIFLMSNAQCHFLSRIMGICRLDGGSTSLSLFHEYILMQQYFVQMVGVFCFTDQNRLTTQQSSELHRVGEKTVQWGEMKKSSIH